MKNILLTGLIVIMSFNYLIAQTNKPISFIVLFSKYSKDEGKTWFVKDIDDSKDRFFVYDKDKALWTMYLKEKRVFTIIKKDNTSNDTETHIIYQCVNEKNDACVISYGCIKDRRVILLIEGDLYTLYGVKYF